MVTNLLFQCREGRFKPWLGNKDPTYCRSWPKAVKNLLADAEHRSNSWVGKIPWRRKWQPTPVFLPGKSHGQRSLAGYRPWGCKRAECDLVTK